MNTREYGFSVLVIPLVLSTVFLIGAIAFGVWAFSNMLDYKNNVTAKVNTAVTVAKQQEDGVKDAQFAQQEKYPFRTYAGPSAYGNITVQYPKTWSAYVIDDTNSSPFIDGYFYPNTVPDTQSQQSSFALRIQLVQDSYNDVLTSITGSVQQGQVKVSPYAFPKEPTIVGARVDGAFESNKTGSMIVLPVRNMTLKVWTESPQYEDDFNNNILPNLSFSP